MVPNSQDPPKSSQNSQFWKSYSKVARQFVKVARQFVKVATQFMKVATQYLIAQIIIFDLAKEAITYKVAKSSFD